MFPRHSSQHRTGFKNDVLIPFVPTPNHNAETMFPPRSSQNRTSFRNDVPTPIVPTPNWCQKRCFHAARPNTEPVSETIFPQRSSQHRTSFRNDVPTPFKRCSRWSKHRLPPAMSRVHPFRTAALPPEVHEWRRQIVVIGRLISGENPVLLPCRFSGGQSNDAFISRTL